MQQRRYEDREEVSRAAGYPRKRIGLVETNRNRKVCFQPTNNRPPLRPGRLAADRCSLAVETSPCELNLCILPRPLYSTPSCYGPRRYVTIRCNVLYEVSTMT